MEQIRVFEAFAGYGSQAMALKRLQEEHPDKISFEFIGIAEIEPTAIKAYKAIHGDIKNFGDISKIKWEKQVPDFDLFTYSFPCQDISNAGKQKGLSEGSGSRSSLLWECRRAIEAKKPRYLLMENVKNLVSDKFMADFSVWVQWLYDQGYQNFYEVLNAKDYGVPQNRERVFMISILDDSEDPFDRPAYVFPKPFRLEKRLKDLLETKVAESFYLKEEQVRKIVEDCDSEVAKGCGFSREETENVIQVGNLIPDDGRKFTNPFIGRVYSKEGIGPTLLTMQGGNREPKVLLPLNEYTDGTCRTIKAQYGKSSAGNFVRQDGLGATGAVEILPINTGKDGVCGCITAHYHKAGWADLNPMCQLPHPAVAEIMTDPHYDGVKTCASRKRGDRHKLEMGEDISNAITSIDTDYMVAEPKILTPVRTEEAKRLRRQGIEVFAHKQLQPRKDGISNTITTVEKDNLLQETDPVFLRFGFGHGQQGCNDQYAYTINSSAFEHNNFIVEKPKEGAEYKGKILKEEDAIDTSRSETFGTHVMNGISPTLRAERPEATGCCVKDGYIYRIRKLTPREAFRLMDVSDTDIDKINEAGICKTAQYKLAGNSIVVSCLYHIFKELFITKTKPIQATLF